MLHVTRTIATPREGGFNEVNSHCLGHIVKLAETHEVFAEDDIRDDGGNMLWAKGAPVSKSLRDKLLQRRLAQPLEASLAVAGGATSSVVVADALARIAENPVFEALCASADARALLHEAENAPLPRATRLLLTSARESDSACYHHSVAVMAACAGLASRLQLNTHDAMLLIQAALLHDIGEMYINPIYLRSRDSLSPSEWQYVASHPCVGYAFIREFTTLPAVVADCVLHHHERLDGSGYPFQTRGSALGRLSAILAVADALCAITMRGGCGQHKRIEVALSIAPGEFDRDAASATITALRALGYDACTAPAAECVAQIVPVLDQLRSVQAAAQALAGEAAGIGDYVLRMLANTDKALRAAGLSDPELVAELEPDPAIVQEVCMVVGEVSWRLKNLARNVHMRIHATGQSVVPEPIAELIKVLDPDAGAALAACA